MRKPFVAGNWKMNKTVEEARHFVSQILPELREVRGVEIVLCPPFLSIVPVANLLTGSEIGLGVQNLHWEASGAYTGEVSCQMVKEFCNYAIIGHSERRAYFGETDDSVNKKTKAAIRSGLIAIACVGETLEEREAGTTGEVIQRQIRLGLTGLTAEDADHLVIAYEPVWAIGTGRASSGEDANRVIGSYIRPALAEIIGMNAAQAVRVLYGGSVTPVNAAEFFEMSEIDGALVGGASLKPDFVRIIAAAIP